VELLIVIPSHTNGLSAQEIYDIQFQRVLPTYYAAVSSLQAVITLVTMKSINVYDVWYHKTMNESTINDQVHVICHNLHISKTWVKRWISCCGLFETRTHYA
jgi:hypothetical protein